MINKLFLSILFASSLCLFSQAATAQAYQWKDETGRTIISNEPPPTNTPNVRRVEDPSAGSAVVENVDGTQKTQKSLADQDLEFRKRQLERDEAAQKEAKDAETQKSLADNCTRAKQYLESLKSGERIGRRNEKGETEVITDEYRAQEIKRVEADYNKNCADKK